MHPLSLSPTALCFTLLTLSPLVPVAHAELQPLDDQLMLGIDRDSGDLKQFTFFGNERRTVGTLRDARGNPMLGIEAAAYFPTFQNTYALWLDPSDGRNKLVFANIDDGVATVMADDVEGGKFTGATAYNPDKDTYNLFTVQQEKIKPPAKITGRIFINPNNAADSEFVLTTPTRTFTRDDLHQHTAIAGDGTFYQGNASLVRVKPKGNGTQQGVNLDGQPMTMKNSNTYTFAGSMDVLVYNDHVKNGKAMGQWWITIVTGAVRLNDEVEVLSPNRLALVNQRDGSVTELMALSRKYFGLATVDGVTFYTHDGLGVYRLNLLSKTETFVRSLGTSSASDFEFADGTLQLYEVGYGTLNLVPISDTSGTSQRQVGLGDLGPIMFYGRDFGPTRPLYD